MAVQSICINKQYVQSRISENTDLKQVIIQKELESINLSATNWTFVTKGKIESHWVNTLLSQLVIQFEPSSRRI